MIKINLDKAKIIAHNMRREARASEFEPYDKIIAAQIPGTDAAIAEQARRDIRLKYALIQESIDMAESPEQIKIVINAM